MLLQTLVQLNILILATPALAGWTVMPLGQPGMVRACVVMPGRPAEAAAPRAASDAPVVQTVGRLPSAASAANGTARPADQVVRFRADAPAAAASALPFPHAARAP